MSTNIPRVPIWVALFVAAYIAITIGCKVRSRYRQAADQEAYQTIAERNCDWRWRANNVRIEPNHRSRYFDPYSADCPPMPRDDPAAHRYMHCVDGKKGWKYWHATGTRGFLENQAWRRHLAQHGRFNEEGHLVLNIDSALDLAYLHSPTHIFQLESLYLSSLDVTTERFRLDCQFFGSDNLTYNHFGGLTPAFIAPAGNRYVVTPPVQGLPSNRLGVGALGQENAFVLGKQKTFATAGTLIANFANSFVFEFNGPDAGLSSSLANFFFLQPILAGGGRDVALEQLTLAERILLGNLRHYAQSDKASTHRSPWVS